MNTKRKTHLLLILDGWGHREEREFNAIALAHTPTWDKLWKNYPHTLISGSGMDVGLPDGQMGNSEVGHMNLGAGRVVYQDLTRISKAIEDKTFFSNAVLNSFVDKSIKQNNKLHLIGLLSDGGVHSHEDHFLAAIDLALQKGCKQIYVHAFLDGRDTAPRSAHKSLEKIDNKLKQHNCGFIASIIGRYFAMDRDQRWDRVQLAYDLLTQGKAEFTSASSLQGLQAAYERGENDEFVKATHIHFQNRKITIDENDSVLFLNFRADRARQLSRAFVHDDFTHFSRAKRIRPENFATLTHYADDIKSPCAYPPDEIYNDIGQYLSSLGKTQLRIAETEKYAHVTFFFSGGREELYPGEKRELIPSPKVATYDLQPEMSAYELTDKLVAAIDSKQFDLIVCNYANGDMVGHTGKLDAAIKAAEAVDICLGKINAALERNQAECLITADHGNLEMMMDVHSQQALTSHTCEPVPLIYIGRKAHFVNGGLLSDVAPTLLHIMNIKTPDEMSGKNLLVFDN